MSQPSAVINEAPPEASRIESQGTSNRARLFEIFLVLLVAFGGYFVNSLYSLRSGPAATAQLSNARWSIAIVQELASLLLLGYVLSRRKLRFRSLGLQWSVRDVGAGLLVALVSYAVYAAGYLLVNLLHSVISVSGVTSVNARAFFSHPGVMIIPFSLLNPFFEELIVRAYLMTEVIELTGSATLAVALSIGIQFSYHLYYGLLGAIALAFQFLVFSLYYARWRRALPIVVAHAFFDITALFRLF